MELKNLKLNKIEDEEIWKWRNLKIEADNKVTCEKENSNSEKVCLDGVNVKTEGNMGVDAKSLINRN